MDKRKALLDLHNYFIYRFKPKKSIHISICKLEKNLGWYNYDFDNKIHVIKIDRIQCLGAAVDSLIHEWGHLLQKNKTNMNVHSNSWGVCYARVYRVYLEWLKLQ